ncbi:FRG domain-containing protein [Acetobacterium wieringae]|uniref:FRG domain-containing protein n=1 Tax=Acetobacterium wieringae TaxID=52694 RepID=UPI0026F16DFE|nr:FRG domain-containing protein [Acetobacterium wieringae]
MSEYLSTKYKEKLDNNVIDISYQDIVNLYNQNIKDEKECAEVTQSSYRNENYYDEYGEDNQRFAFYKEVLYRDKKTAGFIMEYPHGTIITQAERNSYYRGENQIYTSSIPTLTRKLSQITSVEDIEIYKLIADMRIAEFGIFLFSFGYVQEWESKYCTVLFDALAQHYGLETDWLDITNDFNVALFFATCFFDLHERAWKPLTKNETEKNESTKYGMIFHCPQWQVGLRNLTEMFMDSQNEEDQILINSILPIGFQPFMRCHMQYGYGIKMEKEYPLQQDIIFEKLRFRHNEKLSRDVFAMMEQGKKIYPHEGLSNFQDIIDQIRTATTFSDEAFEYAFEKGSYFKDKTVCRDKVINAKFCGKNIIIEKDIHPIKVSRQRRRRLDREYSQFSIEKKYGIKLSTRYVVYPQ